MINNDSILNAVTKHYDNKRFNAQNKAYELNAMLNEDQQWVNNRFAIKELSLEIAKAEYMQDLDLANSLKEKREVLKAKRNQILSQKGIDERSLSPVYECEKCQDTGFIHGAGVCDCFYKTLTAVCEDLLQLSPTSLPDFSTYVCADKTEEKYKNLFLDYVEKFPPEKVKNLLISGDTGCGKTFSAGCIASALKGKNLNVIFITAVKLSELFLRYHTASIGDKQAIFSLLTTCDLLVIDDLGTEPLLKNVTVEYLTAVISERLSTKSPFIITTNLTMGEIKERYTERLLSRLSGAETAKISLKGKDKRIKK